MEDEKEGAGKTPRVRIKECTLSLPIAIGAGEAFSIRNTFQEGVDLTSWFHLLTLMLCSFLFLQRRKIFYVLFALMQMGNPTGLRKKDQARPDAPPAGQANAHEQSLRM